MKEERMQILKMVEDGKISVDEAAKLLEAVKATSHDEQNYSEGPSFEEKVKEFSQNAEGFAKDLSGKMGAFYKDMEPKLKKATKVVVEKTASVVDEISKALNESLQNLEKDCCCEKEDCCNEDTCCDEAENTDTCGEENCCCSEETDKRVDNDGNPIE